MHEQESKTKQDDNLWSIFLMKVIILLAAICHFKFHEKYRYNTFLHKLGAHLGRAPKYSEKQMHI